MQSTMHFLLGLALSLIFYVLPALCMDSQELREPIQSSAVALRAAHMSNPPVVYEEALFKSPSVPFDPKKLYYIAFFNDMSHVLIYGFVEETVDPFFSKQTSCAALATESVSTKRARYFNAGGGDVTEVIVGPYTVSDLQKNTRVKNILTSFDKMRTSPTIPHSFMMAKGGYAAFAAKGDVSVIAPDELEFGPKFMEL